MKGIIQQEIGKIEAARGIRILFACESGSRAWGFPSPDSDWDVRFIYARPQAEYLSLREQKDTLDFAIKEDLDLAGWDIRKTLQLIGRSNATPAEWLQSPSIYSEVEGFREACFSEATRHYNPHGAYAHYIGLATGSFKKIENAEQGAKLKTWFYVLRPLLAAKWIRDQATVPPMEFAPLMLAGCHDNMQQLLSDLIAQKAQLDESATLPIPADIESYARALYTELDADRANIPQHAREGWEALDASFLSWTSSTA